MDIFTSSEKAVQFGRIANRSQIKILKILRNYYLQAAKSIPRDSCMENFNTAIVFATQAQFMREALESVILKDGKSFAQEHKDKKRGTPCPN